MCAGRQHERARPPGFDGQPSKLARDPEGAPDYYRQLAMSHLERGKRNEARQVLKQLRKVDATNDSAEFEAGVLSLAGLREEAVVAYRKGLASYPDRIDTYLLLAKTMNLEWGERASDR